jgi:hypothetical protein
MIQNCHDSGPGTPNHEDTTTYQFFNASPAWQDRFEKIKYAAALQAAKTKYQADETRIFPDLNPFIQNVIMVDGLDEDDDGVVKGFSTMQLESLRLMILSHLMTSLPCVAIGTLRHGSTDGWKDSASLVQTNIPVLYIDVRRRPSFESHLSPDELLEAAKKHCNQEWESIASSGRLDVLDVCRMAFWHSVCQSATGRSTAGESRITVNSALSIHDAITQAKNTRVREESNLQVLSDSRILETRFCLRLF